MDAGVLQCKSATCAVERLFFRTQSQTGAANWVLTNATPMSFSTPNRTVGDRRRGRISPAQPNLFSWNLAPQRNAWSRTGPFSGHARGWPIADGVCDLNGMVSAFTPRMGLPAHLPGTNGDTYAGELIVTERRVDVGVGMGPNVFKTRGWHAANNTSPCFFARPAYCYLQYKYQPRQQHAYIAARCHRVGVSGHRLHRHSRSPILRSRQRCARHVG